MYIYTHKQYWFVMPDEKDRKNHSLLDISQVETENHDIDVRVRTKGKYVHNVLIFLQKNGGENQPAALFSVHSI